MPVHRQAVRRKGRFNCCPRTTTLLRSSGGAGWFSSAHVQILFCKLLQIFKGLGRDIFKVWIVAG